jgi:hypothetical protein
MGLVGNLVCVVTMLAVIFKGTAFSRAHIHIQHGRSLQSLQSLQSLGSLGPVGSLRVYGRHFSSDGYGYGVYGHGHGQGGMGGMRDRSMGDSKGQGIQRKDKSIQSMRLTARKRSDEDVPEPRTDPGRCLYTILKPLILC